MKTYVVERGDTLSAIARKFNVSVSEIAKANNITNVNIIHIGDVLNIPVIDHAELGKAVEKCLDAIEALPEFTEVMNAL